MSVLMEVLTKAQSCAVDAEMLANAVKALLCHYDEQVAEGAVESDGDIRYQMKCAEVACQHVEWVLDCVVSLLGPDDRAMDAADAADEV